MSGDKFCSIFPVYNREALVQWSRNLSVSSWFGNSVRSCYIKYQVWVLILPIWNHKGMKSSTATANSYAADQRKQGVEDLLSKLISLEFTFCTGICKPDKESYEKPALESEFCPRLTTAVNIPHWGLAHGQLSVTCPLASWDRLNIDLDQLLLLPPFCSFS